MTAVDNKQLLGGDVLIFWDTTEQYPGKHYWAFAEHGKDPGQIWLFYWNEGTRNWVTFKAVETGFVIFTKHDPRAKVLTDKEVPELFWKWHNPETPYNAY